MKPRINVITVAVDDLEKSLAFYRDSLGWRPRWPAEGTVDPFDHVAFELQSGLSFVLYPRDALARDAQENGSRLNAARRRWPNRKTSLTMSGAQECKIRSEIRGGYLHSKNAFKQLTNQSSEKVVHLVMSDAIKQ